MSRTKHKRTKYPGFLKLHKDKGPMRYLYFDTEAVKEPVKIYEIVYDGVGGSPRGFEGPIENRHVSKFYDKLEAIGKPCQRNGKDSYELDPEKVKGPIILDDAEYTLVYDALKVIRWVGAFSRQATAMFDWLEGAKDKPREEIPEASSQA